MTRKDFEITARALGVAGRSMSDALWLQTLDIMEISFAANYADFNRVYFEASASFHRIMPADEAARVLAS